MIFKKKSNLKTQLIPLEEPPEELAPYRIPFKIGEFPVESAREYLKACREQLEKLHRSHFPSGPLKGLASPPPSEKPMEPPPQRAVGADGADSSLFAVESRVYPALHAIDLVRLNTLYIDDLIQTLFERADWLFQESSPNKSRRCALMALGGYGRSEMSPQSDVDLLFVYPDKPEEYLSALTDSILYVLWDSGLDVGYATRSLKDCRKIIKDDVVTWTSMLDARKLAGDKAVAEEFLKGMQEEMASQSSITRFVEAKLKENEERRKRFGGSVYILEPNVKESEGGLRDFQNLLWFGKAIAKTERLEDLVEKKILAETSLRELTQAKEFLFKVRNALHFLTGQKKDQLTFQYQEEIARESGYEDNGGILAVERFMQAYYRHAANVKRIVNLAVAALVESPEKKLKLIHSRGTAHVDEDFAIAGEKIFAKNPGCFEKNPFNLMRVFLIAQQEGAGLDEETRALITRSLPLADEKFAESPEVNQMIRELFSELKGLGRVLHLMHELKLLERLIPEFGEVVCQVQHDVYHIYTVDTHSIFAVGELSKLKEGAYDPDFPLFKEILQQTPRHDLLSLGTFFHDVGKGRGKNHSIVGAEMAARAAERMGYPDKDREVIEFLVKSHLLMPHLAQRRDLDDANLIIQFAKSMQHTDNLNMLFLLTWADIRAVGPDVWTPWKGTLLTELFSRTRRVLESGSFTRERVNKMVQEILSKVKAIVNDKVPEAVREEYLQNMPAKYFLAHPPEEIARHLELLSFSDPNALVAGVSVLEKDNVNELILHTLGTPGLLAKITGVMAANEWNILEAKQYVSKTGHALVSIRFTDSLGQMIREERRFQAFLKDLSEVMEGRQKISALMEQRQKPSWYKKKLARTFPTRVETDNDVSAYYTVIDIYAHDRLGLLYQILTALSGLGLYVDVSKISTKVDQVADVFYVKDIFGQKVTQGEKLKKIQSELFRVIEGEG